MTTPPLRTQQTGRFSVVIATYNRCDDLRLALQSVVEQEHPDLEILVVDNASEDHTLEMLAREFPDIRVIAQTENRGMDGYSVGFSETSGEFIFQMDSDGIVPSVDTLNQFQERFRNLPEEVAVVVARVEEADESHDLQEVKNRDTRQGPINTGGFHGGVAFRASALHSVGYYNRDVFLYGSELFLQMKILAAGLRILYFPEILLLHKSSPKGRVSTTNFFETRNRYWYFRHFASLARQVRYIPPMLLHDLLYAVWTGSPGVLGRALREAFRPLPSSLGPPLRSTERDFVAKMHEVGSTHGVIAALRRALRKA